MKLVVLKPFGFGKLSHFSEMQIDAMMYREGAKCKEGVPITYMTAQCWASVQPVSLKLGHHWTSRGRRDEAHWITPPPSPCKRSRCVKQMANCVVAPSSQSVSNWLIPANGGTSNSACWTIVGPTSTMLAQRWASIGPMIVRSHVIHSPAHYTSDLSKFHKMECVSSLVKPESCKSTLWYQRVVSATL